jgi:putative transposase
MRLPRLCPAGIPAHITQRGHNRQICFASTRDFATYSRFLAEAADRFHISIHAWVFMTNHVHLLATPALDGDISRMMQVLGRNYVCYFNKAHQRSGTLWEDRFHSCVVESAGYLLQCYRYIELNPVRAGIVVAPADYHWSSYHSNALGCPSSLVTPHAEYLGLGVDPPTRMKAYRALFEYALDDQLVQDLRTATRQNLALGTGTFMNKVEASTARRVRSGKAGRPRNLSPTPILKFDSDTDFRL